MVIAFPPFLARDIELMEYLSLSVPLIIFKSKSTFVFIKCRPM